MLSGLCWKDDQQHWKGPHTIVVIDPSDNPINPKPGTLRYGTTMIKGKKWITFQRSMHIRLEKPLLISSFTTIDGWGANVPIAGNACLMIYKVFNSHFNFVLFKFSQLHR